MLSVADPDSGVDVLHVAFGGLGGHAPGRLVWWDWKAWYSEGSSVAIYFSKFSLDRQYSFVRGAAWF